MKDNMAELSQLQQNLYNSSRELSKQIAKIDKVTKKLKEDGVHVPPCF